MTLEKLNKFFNNEKRVASCALKKHLFNLGIKEKRCEKCCIDTWQGHPAPLELHHLDGDHFNNSLDNLQILCPNCHSLEPSFTSSSKIKKNLKKEQIQSAIETSYNIREVCDKLGLQPKGKNYSTVRNYMSKYGFNLKPSEKLDSIEMKHLKRIRKNERKYATKEEAHKAITKGNYPSDEEMLKLVWSNSIIQLTKVIGVSDNGIRHYCKVRNIPTPPPGYWRKFQTGRQEECAEIKRKAFENWEGLKKVNPFLKVVVAEGFEPVT